MQSTILTVKRRKTTNISTTKSRKNQIVKFSPQEYVAQKCGTRVGFKQCKHRYNYTEC